MQLLIDRRTTKEDRKKRKKEIRTPCKDNETLSNTVRMFSETSFLVMLKKYINK